MIEIVSHVFYARALLIVMMWRFRLSRWLSSVCEKRAF